MLAYMKVDVKLSGFDFYFNLSAFLISAQSQSSATTKQPFASPRIPYLRIEQNTLGFICTGYGKEWLKEKSCWNKYQHILILQTF
jgi:hypothetical protein